MTFSIAARDPETGAVGVAVQSKFVSVGSVVPFVSADAGAVATQAFANVEYGPDGLDHLRKGMTAEETVEHLVADDEEAAERQVGVVEAPVGDGSDDLGEVEESVAAFTGEECFDVAGDLQGDHFTVQGNILENEETLTAMAEAFAASDKGLPERLLAALYAGEEAGGDSRGKQSAALYVAKEGGGYQGGNDRWIDVRVDDHDQPIEELERVFKLYDVTLLEREEPEELRSLSGDTALAVSEALADLGYLDREPRDVFGDPEEAALESFRGYHNFENHSLPVIEDALERGWAVAEGEGEERLVDALWHGLQRLDRK